MARRIDKWPNRVPRQVFIVDDHPIFREGLTEVINGEKDLKVCGGAGSANEALTGVARLKPDLVLVDISLPDKSGLELLRELRQRHRKVKLLVVSMHDEALYANQVLERGGDGYIMKREDPEEIVQAMRDVLDGHIYLSEQVLASQPRERAVGRVPPSPRPLGELSDQELEILEMLGRSLSEHDVAQRLELEPEAIEAAVGRIRKKLHLRSNDEVVRYALG